MNFIAYVAVFCGHSNDDSFDVAGGFRKDDALIEAHNTWC
jgi:hypothetical protein